MLPVHRASSFSGRAVGVRALGGTGWVYRVGIPGGYTGEYPASLKAEHIPAKRAPEASCREAGVGGDMHSARPSPRPTHSDPAGSPGPASLVWASPRLLANKGEI